MSSFVRSALLRKHCNTTVLHHQFRSCVNANVNSAIKEYDVVISGGGMVGSTMAATLGNEPCFADKKILLLEGAPERDFTLRSAYSSRTVAVSPATIKLLDSIGAWNLIKGMRCQPVKGMQVWESCSNSRITFNPEENDDGLAYIVENDVLGAAVSTQLKLMANNVNVKHDCKAKHYSLPTSGREGPGELAQIHLQDGSIIKTKLLIGADGFKSLVRKTAGIHAIEYNYRQNAVVAILKIFEDPENNTAWQRFLKTGPIAMLPLSREHSCLIWSTTADDAKQLMKLADDTFVDAVNHAFWSDDDKNPLVDYATQLFDGALNSMGLQNSSQQQIPPTVLGIQEESRATFPLGFCHASQYVKSRVALIGDAAHRVHPLAGQGVNLGFGDVSCLRDKLVTAVRNGSDLGSLIHLVEYESARQCHNVPVMATLDGLNRLYGSSWTPVVMARSLGLQATNALHPLKEKFVRGASS